MSLFTPVFPNMTYQNFYILCKDCHLPIITHHIIVYFTSVTLIIILLLLLSLYCLL